jgi:hypothetical protein
VVVIANLAAVQIKNSWVNFVIFNNLYDELMVSMNLET